MTDQQAQAERVFAGPLALVRILSLDEVITTARKSAPDPTVFEGVEPFVWRAEASNTRLDSYYTHMSQKTLRNFAANAQDGVSFQNSHKTYELPMGRSISGQYIAAGGNGIARMLADFYTLPGLTMAGVSSDDFIRAVRAGIVKDVSVGFSGGQLLCDLDGEDYFIGECRHILGMEYPAEGDQKGQRNTATGTWDDAQLREVSAVYAGATPGAEVIAVKGQQEADAGRMTPEVARELEARFQVRIRGATHVWAGAHLSGDESATNAAGQPAEGARSMPGETNGQGGVVLTDAERTALALGQRMVAFAKERTLLHEGEEPGAAMVRVVDELDRLRPLADMGRTYKADMVEAALGEGVRAYGAEFARDTYKGMLERASLDEIKRFKDDWAGLAARTLTGGRATTEGGEPDPKPEAAIGARTAERKLPAAAYAS